VNVDEARDVSQVFGIQSLPTFIIAKGKGDGDKTLVGTQLGELKGFNVKGLIELIEKHAESI